MASHRAAHIRAPAAPAPDRGWGAPGFAGVGASSKAEDRCRGPPSTRFVPEASRPPRPARPRAALADDFCPPDSALRAGNLSASSTGFVAASGAWAAHRARHGPRPVAAAAASNRGGGA
eukprot:COSAG04_NODE_524_length_13127_cov_18.191511_14_plen_119_part_00